MTIEQLEEFLYKPQSCDSGNSKGNHTYIRGPLCETVSKWYCEIYGTIQTGNVTRHRSTSKCWEVCCERCIAHRFEHKISSPIFFVN